MEAKCISKAYALLKEAKILLIEKTWKLKSNDNNIILESKRKQANDMPYYRLNTVINKKSNQLFNKILFNNLKDAQNFDSEISEFSILESGNNWRICRQVNQSAWPVWARETVYAQVIIHEDKQTWIVGFSVNHSKAPLQEDKYVRAKINMAIYGLIDMGDKTFIWKLSHIDPSGLITPNMLTLYSDKIVSIVNNWK